MQLIRIALLILALAALSFVAQSKASAAPTKEQIDKEVDASLKQLYAQAPTAKALGQKAKGILVVPDMRTAAFVVGGQHGTGALIKNGAKAGYFSSSSVSVGLQAGAQAFALALFFMTDRALSDFEKSSGFVIGTGPSIVFVDAGMAKAINNLTAKSDIYGFVYGQKGLMAGVNLQGTKISKIEPDRKSQ